MLQLTALKDLNKKLYILFVINKKRFELYNFSNYT